MVLTIKMLRKGSRGITATLENADHHAKPCFKIIKETEKMLNKLPFSFTWEQGHNIHILVAQDGRKIAFRPYYLEGRWGIDVLSKHSRSSEMRLMTLFDHDHDVVRLENFLRMFFKCPPNRYGGLRLQSKE